MATGLDAQQQIFSTNPDDRFRFSGPASILPSYVQTAFDWQQGDLSLAVFAAGSAPRD